ncbi:hypothetical protein MASR1M107_05790 [Ignavibacteriales bacterium]
MSLEIIDSNIEDLMSIYGMAFTHREGYLCSCVGENNGVPQSRCGCEAGYRYKSPTTFYGIKTTRRSRFDRSAAGLMPDVTAQLTIPKFHNGVIQPVWKLITHGDLITIPSKTMVKTDVLTKGRRDKIFDHDLREILEVSRLERIYSSPDDYSVNLETRVITWNELAERIPQSDQSYSVKYICTQQYIIYEDEPFDRGGDGEDLPRKLTLLVRKYRESMETVNPLDGFKYNDTI